MAYVKTVWKDSPDTTTPLNAANLNKIEKGIGDLDTALGTTNTNVAKKIDLPATANEGDVLTYSGGKWIAKAPTAGA